ncbi:3-deoxy-D-manno-octulosonic acid kinase [Alteromonas sp. ASW11-130]|uniref:3-deoxy-D-manno-octulosonic acid kinase n=1 Tax=Alteromonas sp. ASW11-130 TaxID=3015775 RepID=UPI002241F0F3|nr:3-deoxy-D-manno-octulosonic acid kinase [Alteromonas sp. ASW11-130]MCW8091178.1 3-deoxy-D-manno-octulosonic acid kinase [Alteromonas sp. ASW11-130]
MDNLPYQWCEMTIKQQQIGRRQFVLFDETIMPRPEKAFFDVKHWQRQNKIVGRAKGRGTTVFIKSLNDVWVLRHFRRGGMIGKVLEDQYFYTGLSRTRAFTEFNLLTSMKAMNLPVPTPIAAYVSRRGFLYRADLLTRLIPHSEDLHSILCRRDLAEHEWHHIGETIARFHTAQIYHHDLNVRNIMLNDQSQAWLIDFDRCYKRAGNGWKQDNLARLRRSLVKERGKHTTFKWTEADWQSLMMGYRQYQT